MSREVRILKCYTQLVTWQLVLLVPGYNVVIDIRGSEATNVLQIAYLLRSTKCYLIMTKSRDFRTLPWELPLLLRTPAFIPLLIGGKQDYLQ